MQHWFVYYKLDAAAADDVEPAVRRLLQAVQTASGARARLMQRTDNNDATTLLEVYEGVRDPAAFEGVLADAVAQAGLPETLAAQRRTERFEER